MSDEERKSLVEESDLVIVQYIEKDRTLLLGPHFLEEGGIDFCDGHTAELIRNNLTAFNSRGGKSAFDLAMHGMSEVARQEQEGIRLGKLRIRNLLDSYRFIYLQDE